MQRQSHPSDYDHSRGRGRRPLLGTICGLFFGVAAIALWMATFSPHGGIEFSAFLFPLSRVVLEWLYPTQSVPVLLWYRGALLQWILIGALVDIARMFIRRRQEEMSER